MARRRPRRWQTRTVLSLLAVFAATAPLFAASPASFDRVVGGPELDRGIGVTQLADGGYAVVGLTASFGAGAEDVYVVRFDPEGAVLWSQSYGGAKDDNGWSVLELESGDLVVAGFTNSFGEGGFDCYLMRTDPSGVLRWSRTFGGAEDDRCWDLLSTVEGGFVLVGETASSGRGARDCYLLETDADGNEQWAATFGGEKDDRCFAVAASSEGGYVVAGQSYSEGAGDRDVYVIGVDRDGVEQWTKTFGGADSDVGHGVVTTSDGDFLVTGYTTSLASEADDPFLVKLSATGELRWTRVVPRSGLAHTLTGATTADAGFCLGGFEDSGASRNRAAILLKTDRDGAPTWSRSFHRTADGEAFGYTVKATSDGGCVLAGHTTLGANGGLDLLLVKVDRAGR